MDLWTPLAVVGVVVEVLVVDAASLGDEPSGLVRASRPDRELKGGDGLDEFLRLVELLKDWRWEGGMDVVVGLLLVGEAVRGCCDC